MEDTFMCKCGPCRGFWKKSYGEHSSLLEKSSLSRAAETAIMLIPVMKREDHPAVLKLGDRVIVKGQNKGVVKFIGILSENLIAPDTYVGVHLEENVHSRDNGIFKGKRYFHCPMGHGAMVKYSDVRLINPPDKKPPIYGNEMFPSYKEIQKRRQEAAQRQGERNQHKGDGDVMEDTEQRNTTASMTDQNNQSNHPEDTAKQDDPKKKKIQTIRRQFGGGQRADIMVKTLKKLQKGYKEGLKVKTEEYSDFTDEEL